jgi:hypothetical protein
MFPISINGNAGAKGTALWHATLDVVEVVRALAEPGDEKYCKRFIHKMVPKLEKIYRAALKGDTFEQAAKRAGIRV